MVVGQSTHREGSERTSGTGSPPSPVPPNKAAEFSGGRVAMNLEAVDAGVVLVPPVVVHLQLHVTEGVLTRILRRNGAETSERPKAS